MLMSSSEKKHQKSVVPPVRVYAVWEEINKRNRNGIAPCAYAFTCPVILGEQVLWGRGGEKSSQVMLAHLIPRIVNELAQFLDKRTTFELVLRNTGTDLYFDEHIWKWMNEEHDGSKVTGQRYELWRKALEHKVIGRIELVKANSSDEAILSELSLVAGEQAKKAYAAKEHLALGLKWTDSGPVSVD